MLGGRKDAYRFVYDGTPIRGSRKKMTCALQVSPVAMLATSSASEKELPVGHLKI